MTLANLTSTELKRISKLIERKEQLQAQIDQINRELGAYSSGGPAARTTQRRGPKRYSRRRVAKRRGALKDSILAELKSAGAKGISVKELAEKLGNKRANVYAWFMATGKKVKGIKKVAPATFAWKG